MIRELGPWAQHWDRPLFPRRVKRGQLGSATCPCSRPQPATGLLAGRLHPGMHVDRDVQRAPRRHTRRSSDRPHGGFGTRSSYHVLSAIPQHRPRISTHADQVPLTGSACPAGSSTHAGPSARHPGFPVEHGQAARHRHPPILSDPRCVNTARPRPTVPRVGCCESCHRVRANPCRCQSRTASPPPLHEERGTACSELKPARRCRRPRPYPPRRIRPPGRGPT
jgi:hypothetical protein